MSEQNNVLDATVGTAAAPLAPVKDFTPQISLEPDAPEASQHVLDIANSTIVKVPLSQIPVLVGSGKYALPDSGSQYVTDSSGELGQIPNSKYAEAIKSGKFLPASEQEIKTAQYNQKFGDSEGIAALAGAARGATFGLSDQLLTKGLGVQKGTLAGLQEANPASSIAGEIGGVVASSFIPGTLVARAAKGAVAAGNVVGKAAVSGLQKLAVKAGVSNAVATSIVAKSIPTLAGSAVEAGLYGAGQLISENALGKADFNAENLASYAGTGALFGAGVGAVLGAGAAILPGAKSVLKSTIGQQVDDFVSKEKNAFDLFGVKGAKLEKELKRNPKLGQEVVDALLDESKIGPTALKAGDDALLKKLGEMKEAAGAAIGSVSKQVDDVAAVTPGILPKTSDIYNKLAASIDDTLLAPLRMGKSGEFNPARITEAKAMQATAESFKELSAKMSGDMSMAEMHALMKQFDAGARFDKFAAVDPVKIAINKNLRYVMRNELDNLAEKVSGDLKTTLKTANKDYSIASKLSDFLEHKMAVSKKPVGLDDIALAGVGLGAGNIADAASLVGVKQLMESNLRRRFVILGGIEKANMYADKLINNSVTNFFKNAAGPVRKATVGQLVDFSLSTDDAGRKPKNDTQAYYNLMQNVDRYAANPDVLVEKLNRRTAQIYDEAPETAAALDMVGQRAVMFLSSKLPRKESMPGMLKRPYQPSNLEMAKFKRYVGVVEDPLSAVKNLENGTMTADEAEALKVVYPNIFERLQNKVIEHVSDNANIPYSRKLQLGILMDVATDASLLPQNVLGLQSTFQSEAGNDQQNQGVVKPSQKGLQSLDFASRVEGKDKE